MKRRFNQVIGIIALVISFLFSSVSHANIDTIVVSNFVFTPSNVTITSGDSVYFSGASSFHPVAQDGNAWTPMTVSTMISSEIATPGNYPFYCTVHGGAGGVGMSGVITVLPLPDPIYINEIHYDNTGGDVNEGVEIAGPAGTDLNCYSLLFYNGADSLEDPSLSLSGIIPDLGCGYGTIWFPKSGIQNGAPDGIALYDSCNATVMYFLSYEGVFMALDGPAAGMTSTDIGVAEPGAVGQSLQLTGIGSIYTDFTWSGPITSTYDQFNQGQIFCAGDTTLSLVITGMGVKEDTGVVTIEVSIFNPSPTTSFTVDLVYSSGTASLGTDFTFTTQTLTFPASDSSNQSATITIVDDVIPESAESIVLMLQNVSAGAKLGSDSILTIIIKGNDVIIPSCSDLFYSEYVEGTSNNKAVEVYNPRSDTVDLSTYTFLRRNGGSTTVNSYVYNGMLAPGDVFVIVNSGADSINLLPLGDTTSTLTFYNGDDALAIVNGAGDTVDVFGEWGVDPGTNWPVDTGATNEYTLVRKAGIQQGGLYWDVVATEWDVYAQNDFTNLGSHTMTPCVGLSAAYSVTGECFGDSACFTDLSYSSDTSIVSWFWDFGDATTDTVQNPCHTFPAPATYTVVLMVVDSSGDTSIISQPVTIQAMAIVTAGIDQIVCASSACVALNGSVSGGSTTGIWTTTGSGAFSPNATDLSACYAPSTSDTTAGIVELILSSTNNGACATSTDTTMITFYPPPNINATSVVIDSSTCGNSDGNITGITASSAMAPLTYDWVNGASASVGSAADLTLVPADSYTLTVSDSTGCSASVGPYMIIAAGTPAAPTASSPSAYCTGETIADLTATGTGGTLYWSSNNAMTDTLGTGSPFASGATSTDTFYVAEFVSCIGPATMVIITVNPTPASNFSMSPNLLAVSFTNLSTGSIAIYGWIFGDGNTSSLPNPSNTYGTDGTYNVCLTVTSGLGCSDSSCQSITVTAVGIDEAGSNAEVSIYPNPNNNGLFFLQIENLTNERFNISVYNAIGKELMRSEYESNQMPTAINLNDHGPGIYYLRLTNRSNNINRKIIFIK